MAAVPETSPEKDEVNNSTALDVLPDFETSDDDEPTDEEKKKLRRGKNLLCLQTNQC